MTGRHDLRQSLPHGSDVGWPHRQGATTEFRNSSKSRRAVLTRRSLEVRWRFGTRLIRFDALEGFTFDARSYRLYLFVPVGRVAVLTLWGGGRRVRFHGGFARFDEYGVCTSQP